MGKKRTALKELFIEELGQVKGGIHAPTTVMQGEETHVQTTRYIGETEEPTTLALGEEDG